MKIYISPPNKTDWRLDSGAFASWLSSEFSGVLIRERGVSQAHSVEWTWVAGQCEVEGSLDAEGNTIVLDGDIDRCAEFAVRYRAYVPVSQALVYYDEGYTADVALRPETRTEDLTTPF